MGVELVLNFEVSKIALPPLQLKCGLPPCIVYYYVQWKYFITFVQFPSINTNVRHFPIFYCKHIPSRGRKLAPKSFRAAKELFITLPSPCHGAVSSTQPMVPIGQSAHCPFPILDSDRSFNFPATFFISPFKLIPKIRVLWNDTPCRLLYTEYGDTATFETSVIIYQLTRCNKREIFRCYQHRCENIRSRWYQFCPEDGGSISFRNAGIQLPG